MCRWQLRRPACASSPTRRTRANPRTRTCQPGRPHVVDAPCSYSRRARARLLPISPGGVDVALPTLCDREVAPHSPHCDLGVAMTFVSGTLARRTLLCRALSTRLRL